MQVGELFATAPDHWELRGDELLWARLRDELASEPLPADTRQMERLLETAFWNATGNTLAFSTQILVEQFAEQGKSRGGISGADWRYRLFPLILARFEQAQKPAAA